MNRQVLIVLNPGDEKDKEHYCAGVYRDRDNYINFFQSNKGGAWEDYEITVRDSKSYSEIAEDLERMDRLEYSIIIFSGHGYTNISDEMILELNTYGEECRADELCRQNRTVILDCCRKVYYPSLEKYAVMDGMLLEESYRKVSRADARRMYEDEIRASVPASIVLCSCAYDECSKDYSDRGGLYSSHLISAGRRWKGHGMLSVVSAHEIAKSSFNQDKEKQHPQIYKPRLSRGSYYPFALDVE